MEKGSVERQLECFKAIIVLSVFYKAFRFICFIFQTGQLLVKYIDNQNFSLVRNF